jgi:hypothetical protein
MTVERAAALLKRSPGTIQEWCALGPKRGGLKAEKVWTRVKRGEHWMSVIKWSISPDSVRRVLARRTQPQHRSTR